MKQKQFIITILLTLLSLAGKSQQKEVFGYIVEFPSNLRLKGILIRDSISKNECITDKNGYYSIKSDSSNIFLEIKDVSYKPQSKSIRIKKLTRQQDFTLVSKYLLDEVNIHDNQSRINISTTKIKASQLESAPQIGGEIDIIRSLNSLPGIQSGSSTKSEMIVRGSGHDQNLILLENIPIYNANHLMGVFSAINMQSIQTFKFYKSAFPAQYNNYLSSVLDLKMGTGNNQNSTGAIEVGTLSSKITFSTPLFSKKTKISLSARRSLLDLFTYLLKDLISSDINSTYLSYRLYDITSKIHHQFNSKNHISISCLISNDKFSSDQNSYSTNYDWGNYAIGANHYSKLTNNLSLKTHFSKSKYTSSKSEKDVFIIDEQSSGYKFKTSISNISMKANLTWHHTKNHSIRGGTNYQNMSFIPGEYTFFSTNKNNNTEDIYTLPHTSNILYDIYLQNNFQHKKWDSQIGINYSSYHCKEWNKSHILPRVLLSYTINSNIHIQASYSKMLQTFHKLSYNSIINTNDSYLPANENQIPMLANQISIGTELKLRKSLSITIETYYKLMKNLLEYKLGADEPLCESNFNELCTTTSGKSYGIEILFQKKAGLFTGWLAYTYSRSMRESPDLNNGKEFPYKYDRPHQLSFTGIYHINEHINLSTHWIYASGHTYTQATSISPCFNFEGNTSGMLSNYDKINGSRMKAYHRLDININLTKQLKQGIQKWSFGLYNAYNKHNAEFIYPALDDNSKLIFKQVCFMPIIPNISYSFKW